MRQNRLDKDWQRAVRYVTDRTQIVNKQRQHLVLLRSQGASTATAENVLAKSECSLLQMQNYLEILEVLRQRNYDTPQ